MHAPKHTHTHWLAGSHAHRCPQHAICSLPESWVRDLHRAARHCWFCERHNWHWLVVVPGVIKEVLKLRGAKAFLRFCWDLQHGLDPVLVSVFPNLCVSVFCAFFFPLSVFSLFPNALFSPPSLPSEPSPLFPLQSLPPCIPSQPFMNSLLYFFGGCFNTIFPPPLALSLSFHQMGRLCL